MIVNASISPENSLLLVMDPRATGLPVTISHSESISFTEECIAIGTLSESDGLTHIILTDDFNLTFDGQTMKKMFAGKLKTPTLEVHVCTVRLEVLGKLQVSDINSYIEVWTNDIMEPDKILIRLSTT